MKPLYTNKRYLGGTESKLEKTEIDTTKDDTYSLESVLKLYEGYGYTTVE